MDKWSWDNNHEVNFCSREKEHILAFQSVYNKVLKDCDLVSNTPTPYPFTKFVKVKFWTTFLSACNYCMNYRNMIKYEYRVMMLKKLYRERFVWKSTKRLSIDEDKLRLYKGLNIEWDDAIGVDH